MTKNKIIYFGTYPQAEVVPNEEAMTTIAEGIRNGDDYVIDKNIYDELIGLPDSAWDAQGDVVAPDGNKYRRVRRKDATYANGNGYEGYYQWNNTYHYFKHQPIKWRVLSAEGGTTLLLADMALDCQRYHDRQESITWGKSDIRDFLNSKFFNAAFSDNEKGKVVISNLANPNNPRYDTLGREDTEDKVFLFSIAKASDTRYGFKKEFSESDNLRQCKSSSYAKAMGIYSNDDNAGNCWWWLRSPGSHTDFAACVNCDGWGFRSGSYVSDSNSGVRPALRVNL